MGKSLTILVDVDNVLEDLNTPWVNAINKKYGTSVQPSEIIDWDITKFFSGLSKTQVFSPLHSKELWDLLTPLENSQKIMKSLIDDGHRILIVTSAHPDTIPFKYNFLKRYFPFIPFKDVIITSHKQMVKGDILIDDAPHNLKDGEYLGILMDAPHNKEYNESSQAIVRVHNWDEIYSIVNNLGELI